MADERLTDRHGRLIGTIRTERDGRKLLWDSHGRKLGSYDPKRNITYDHRGSPAGQGNLLVLLLKCPGER